MSFFFKGPDPEEARRDDGERSSHLKPVRGQRRDHDRDLGRGRKTVEAEKNDPGGCETLAEHELAEILVGGEKQDFRFPRESEDVEVGAAGRFFPEVDDKIALRAESLNDLPLDPFVGDDSHAAGKG